MAFKSVFSDITNMVQQHTSEDNLMMIMLNDGSKASMFKCVQQTACVIVRILERKQGVKGQMTTTHATYSSIL
jgi:hypothetical protein